MKRRDVVNTRIFRATATLAAGERGHKGFLLCALLLCLALPALQAQNTFTGFAGGSINHVFYLGNDNHIYEVYYSNGKWWPSDLTRHTGAPLAAEQSPLTSWFDNASVEHVFYLSSDGNIHELFDDSWGWHFNNLTSNPAIYGGPAPTASGSLTSFVDGQGRGSLFYDVPILGASEVRQMTYSSQGYVEIPPGWATFDSSLNYIILSTFGFTVWGEFNSALTSYIDGSGLYHVSFLTPNGHVQQLYTNANSTWWVTTPDLTAQTGAPAAALNSSLTSFYDSYGIEHVFFQTPNGHIWELYRHWGQGWNTSDLTAGTGSLPAVGALTSFFDRSTGEHVFYQSADGHIRELHNNGAWYPSDLTTAAGAPSWGPGTAAATSLTSYIDNFYIMHVFYRSWSGHVIELYYNGHWWSNDLTQNAGAPLAQPY